MNIKTILLTLVAFSTLPLSAGQLPSDSTNQSKRTLKVTPIGRLHVDGAVYLPDHNGFKSGVAIPEVRAGVKANYGNWMARIEVGLAYGKVAMKDVYVQNDFTKNDYFRVGYFIPQFGIRGAASASLKPAMTPQISESFFRTMVRKIGVGYARNTADYNISAAAFVGGRSMTITSTEQGKVSVGGAVRGVWHPLTAPGEIVQVGVSAAYETASHNRVMDGDGEEEVSPGYRTFSAKFPTGVSSVSMLESNVDDAIGEWKISPELVLSKGRLALESQYYYMNVQRHHGLHNYHATGAYGMLRGLVMGDSQYSYSQADGALALPKPKTLELVAGYNYVNADTRNAGILGGISNDWFLCCNYYINKYMLARLRYSYTTVRNSPVQEDCGVNIIQARLQFVF